MDFSSISNVKELLLRHKTKPSKGLGQNFLVDRHALAVVIKAAQLSADDTVLEIGPGIGTLTQALCSNTKKVIAIEKDASMVAVLKETLKDQPNIEVIQGNILTTPYPLISTPYKVVANLPYYITSPVIRLFLESKNQPELLVLMVQKEVAQRICAKPPDMSLLAVSVQYYADAKIIAYVKKESFWPRPKVDSAIIKIVPRDSVLDSALFRDNFFEVVKAGFSQPRKQLANNLSKSLKKPREQVNQWLLKNGLQPAQRAETLSVQDWKNLTASFE